MSAIGRTPVAPSLAVRWRKLLLRRRDELLFKLHGLEQLWNEHFPNHDLMTLRRKQPEKSAAEAHWDAPSWKVAARTVVASATRVRGHD
jgi:hypothetical protein